jgi:hypothetical protein
MMISSFSVYLITLLDGVNVFFAGLMWLSAIILVISISASVSVCGKKDDESIKVFDRSLKVSMTSIICIIFFGVLTFLTPNTKEAAAIYLIPKIANNEEVKKLPNNLLKVINTKAEEYINGLADDGDKDK